MEKKLKNLKNFGCKYLSERNRHQEKTHEKKKKKNKNMPIPGLQW